MTVTCKSVSAAAADDDDKMSASLAFEGRVGRNANVVAEDATIIMVRRVGDSTVVAEENKRELSRECL